MEDKEKVSLMHLAMEHGWYNDEWEANEQLNHF